MLLAAVLQAEALLEGAGAGVPVEEGVVLEALLVHAFLAARVEQAHGCRVQKNDLIALDAVPLILYLCSTVCPTVENQAEMAEQLSKMVELQK